MWKKYMVMIGGAILVLSLPMAAQAVTAEDDAGTYNPYTAEEARFINQSQDRVRPVDGVSPGDQVQAREETAVRQQLRVHIDAEPPTDTDPLQTRSQERTRLATGSGETSMGDIGAHRGNSDAPMLGDGTGDCVMDGEQEGDGPHGPKGPNKG